MKLIALLLPFLLMGGINRKDKQETTNNNVSKEAVVANVEQEETTQTVKKPKMLNRSGNETFLSEAYPTGTTGTYTSTHLVSTLNTEYKVAHYWDTVVKYNKSVDMYDDNFPSLIAQEQNGYSLIGVKIKFKARATKSNTKLRTKVTFCGFEYDPTPYTDIPKNNTIDVETGIFEDDLYEVMYKDSSLSIQIESNSGGVFTEKVAYIKNVQFEFTFRKPTNIGSGTFDDPYMIYNHYQLKAVENEMDANYKVANDIYFDNVTSWSPIQGVFNGCFNGGNHYFRNFNIHEQYTSGETINVGLFETLGTDGAIEHLNFVNSEIYITVWNINPTIYAGFVAGKQNSDSYVINCGVIDCYISVASPISYVGSIVGYSLGEIHSCDMRDSGAYGRNVLGGIVGMSDGGIIAYSSVNHSFIELEAGANFDLTYCAGGIAGYMLNCRNIERINVTGSDFICHGEIICNPAMGYIVGFLNNTGLSSFTVNGNTHNDWHSLYFFTFAGGLAGRTAGTCAFPVGY